MKYFIHACNEREWYVREFLVPSLKAQGIKAKDIKVWSDPDGIGNLASFIASSRWISKNYNKSESTWHLQDDVCISKRFREIAEKGYDGFANGFCNEIFDGERTNYIGQTTTNGMWFSFQCILIPNSALSKFVKWYDDECIPNDLYPEYVNSGRCDDSLFREWAMSHANLPAINLFPNIVDHIDFMIGGTVINKQRKGKRQSYWRDEYLDEAVNELSAILEKKKK